jgi:hypothetical protein
MMKEAMGNELHSLISTLRIAEDGFLGTMDQESEMELLMQRY